MLYVNGKPYVAPAQSPEEAAPVAAEPVGVPVAQPRQQELPWWKRYMEAASHPLPIALGIQAARTLGLYKPQAGAAVERAIRTVSDPAEKYILNPALGAMNLPFAAPSRGAQVLNERRAAGEPLLSVGTYTDMWANMADSVFPFLEHDAPIPGYEEFKLLAPPGSPWYRQVAAGGAAVAAEVGPLVLSALVTRGAAVNNYIAAKGVQTAAAEAARGITGVEGVTTRAAAAAERTMAEVARAALRPGAARMAPAGGIPSTAYDIRGLLMGKAETFDAWRQHIASSLRVLHPDLPDRAVELLANRFPMALRAESGQMWRFAGQAATHERMVPATGEFRFPYHQMPSVATALPEQKAGVLQALGETDATLGTKVPRTEADWEAVRRLATRNLKRQFPSAGDMDLAPVVEDYLATRRAAPRPTATVNAPPAARTVYDEVRGRYVAPAERAAASAADRAQAQGLRPLVAEDMRAAAREHAARETAHYAERAAQLEQDAAALRATLAAGGAARPVEAPAAPEPRLAPATPPEAVPAPGAPLAESPYDVRYATQETMFGPAETTQLPPPPGRQMSMEESAGMAVQPPAPEGQVPMLEAPAPAAPEVPAAPTETPQDRILAALENPLKPDGIVAATGLPPHEVSSALTIMELTGKVTKHPEGFYLRAGAAPAAAPAVEEPVIADPEELRAKIVAQRAQVGQLRGPLQEYRDYLRRAEKHMLAGTPERTSVRLRRQAVDAAMTRPTQRAAAKPKYLISAGLDRAGKRVTVPFKSLHRAVVVWDRHQWNPLWVPPEWSRLSDKTIEAYWETVDAWGQESRLNANYVAGDMTDEQHELLDLHTDRASHAEMGFDVAAAEDERAVAQAELDALESEAQHKIESAHQAAAEDNWPAEFLQGTLDDIAEEYGDRMDARRYRLRLAEDALSAQVPEEEPAAPRRGGRVALKNMTLEELQAEYSRQREDKLAAARALADMPHDMRPPALWDLLEPMLRQELGPDFAARASHGGNPVVAGPDTPEAPDASTPGSRAANLAQRVHGRQGPSEAFDRLLAEQTLRETESELRHVRWLASRVDPERIAEGLAVVHNRDALKTKTGDLSEKSRQQAEGLDRVIALGNAVHFLPEDHQFFIRAILAERDNIVGELQTILDRLLSHYADKPEILRTIYLSAALSPRTHQMRTAIGGAPAGAEKTYTPADQLEMMLRGMHPSVRPNISAYLDAEGNVILEKLTKYERGIYDAVQGLVRLGERMWQALNVPVQGLTGKTLGDLGDYVSKQGLSEEDPVARIMRRGVPGSPTFSLQDHALAATHADLFDSMLSQWNVMAAGGDPRALDTDPLSQYSDYLAGLGSAYTRWGIKQYLLEHWPTYAQISAQYGEKGLAEVKDWLPFTGVKGPGAEALAQIPLPAPVRAFLSNLYMEGSLVPELKGGGFLRMLSRPFSVGMLLTRKFLIPQFLQQPLTAHLSGTDLTSHPREGAEALYLIPKVFALRSLRSFGHVSPRSAADKILYGAAVAAMKLRPLSAEGLAKAEMYRDEMNKYGISSGSLAHSAARWEEGTLRAALVKGLHLSRADKELRPLMRLATQFFFAADDYGRSYIYIVQRELGNTPAQAARAVADWTPTYSPEYSALIDNYLGEFALYYKYSRQVYGQMMRLAFQRPGLLLLMIRAKQLEDLGMGYDEEWQNLMSAGADPQKWGQFEYRHWRWDLWPATMFPKELLPPFPPKPLTQAEIDAGVPPRKPGGVLVAYKGQPVLSMRTRFQFFEIAGEWAQLATGGAKAWLRRANPILGSGDTLAQRGVAKTLQNLPIVSNFYRKFSRTAPGQRASADFLTAWAKQGISTEEVVRRGLTPKDAIAPLFMRDPSNAETRRLAAKAHVSPTRVWFYYEVEMTNLLLGRAKLESYGISHDVEWTGVMLARMALPGLERQKVLAQEKLARGETPLYTPREIDAYIEKRQGATSTKERKATPGALAPAKR